MPNGDKNTIIFAKSRFFDYKVFLGSGGRAAKPSPPTAPHPPPTQPRALSPFAYAYATLRLTLTRWYNAHTPTGRRI